jgi:AmmeMemoRadiSam system protein B/AmmeMemoRadiSam system protein A
MTIRRSTLLLGMLLLVAALTVFLGGACAAEDPKASAAKAAGKVHPCAGADRWFPGDGDRLGRLVDAYLSGMTIPMAKPPVALIVPHAGYQFSGTVAGKAYATLKGRSYKRVILLGLSHVAPMRGASVLSVNAYETPLGAIPVDIEARDALLKCSAVTEQPAAHEREHSVENQLPMLQRAIKDFKMVEVLVGDLTGAQRAALADAVRGLVTDGTLLVASSDFTHYGPNYGYVPFNDRVPERLQMLNNAACEKIMQIDVAGWDVHLDQSKDTICGRAGIGLLLKVVEPWEDVRAVRVAFDASGQQSGDWTNSVTYASLVFWREGAGLTKAEQETLLRLARDTVAGFLKAGRPPETDAARYDLTPALKAQGAAFVTLKNGGELRGCIGHIFAVAPLYESVTENACHACRDPRFTDNPIAEKEVPKLSIEISVLSPIRRLTDLKSIKLGRDGLVMGRGQRRGLFLPQVPIEQGWDRQQYLENLCRKAGLPVDALQDPQTEFYRFTAQVFGEEKPKEEKAKEK